MKKKGYKGERINWDEMENKEKRKDAKTVQSHQEMLEKQERFRKLNPLNL